MDTHKKRQAPRKKYNDVPCLISFPDVTTSVSATILDASMHGAFLRLWGAEPGAVPRQASHGTLAVEDLRLPFTVVRTSPGFGRADTWFAVRFDAPSSEFIQRLDAFSSEREAPCRGQVLFESKVDIEYSSFFDSVIQLATLYVVVDAATHILLVLQQSDAIETRPVPRPKLLRIASSSPIKGAVDVAQGVMAVAKAADDLMRHRQEQTMLKKEEVLQAREATKQQTHKTTQTKAGASIAETDALVRRFTADSDILNARMDVLKREVELSREEVMLYRERLAALAEGWKFAKDVFAEGSDELAVLRKKLLPAISWLMEDTSGLQLRFAAGKRQLGESSENVEQES